MYQIGTIFDLGLNKHLSHDDVLRLVAIRIEHISRLKISENERILLHKPNTYEFLLDLLALWHLKLVAIPIPYESTDYEIEQYLKLAQAKWILSDSTIVTFKKTKNINTSSVKEFPYKPITLDIDFSSKREALILFSSGTTGKVKGIAHSLYSIMQRIISLRKVINSEELKNTMCILPLSFGHGLIGNSLLPFLSGANLFIAPVFNSNFFLVWKEWLQKHKITFFSTVPSFWRMLGRSDQLPKNTSLLRVHCASSVFTFNLWSQIENWIIEQNINFYNVYGLTEFASWVSGYNLKEEGYRPNYIGRTWGVDCKAIETNVDNIGEGCEVIETNVGSIGEIYEAIETNVDSIGEICEAIETNVGGIGEICLDSDSKMLGYLDERNASVLKADSWIKTGDIGKIENDKLFFYGRSTNTINRGGKKISPEEIENVINLHEKVKDSFVFGHQLKSSEQQIIALVNPRVSGENQSVLLNELKLLCRSKLSKYKIPSIWHIVDDLFYNARGKLDRKKSFEHFINSKTLF